jgi:hypothetical protein
VTGIEGQALDLSVGTDTVYVEVPDNPVINVGIGEFTYSLLLNIPDYAGNREILHKGSADGSWFGLTLKDSILSFTIDDGTNESSVVLDRANVHLYDTTGEDDGWNHIVAIRDRIKDSLFLYINQRMVSSAKDNTEGSIGSASPLIFGAMDAKFNGILDEIRYYNEPIVIEDLQTLTRKYGIDPKYIPSSVADLKSITIIPAAALDPSFDKDVLEYAVELPDGTTSIRVVAFPQDIKANVTGTGDVDVSSGTGTAEIVVTAEDGYTVKTYTINFTVIVGINDVISADLKVFYNSLDNCLVFANRDNIDRVEIYSIDGRKLYVEENISTGRMYLNSANLQGNTVYIARIHNGNEFGILKFVK